MAPDWKRLLRVAREVTEGKPPADDLFQAMGLQPVPKAAVSPKVGMQPFLGMPGMAATGPKPGGKGYSALSGVAYPSGGAEGAPKPQKWISAGGVVLAGTDPEGMARVWIRKSNPNPGYPSQWSFAKGRIDAGESKSTTAVREVEEEMGLNVSILASGYLGSFEGSFSKTHYYLMVARGSPGRHDKETSKVALVTWPKAMAAFGSSGNDRDVNVAKTALAHIRKQYGIDALHGTWVDDEAEEHEEM